MKKRLMIIFLLITIILTLTSCNKKNDKNAAIQLWYYDYGPSFGYSESITKLIEDIEKFCIEKDIPLNIVKHDEKTLSYEDYILKRNLATASGNMIIIEDINSMWDVSKQHADYTKLEHYSELLDEYKGNFCIPIGVTYIHTLVDHNILNYYGIKLDKSIITNDEYLDIKNQMKEKGAKFKLNYYAYYEEIKYFQTKFGLRQINETSEILTDLDKFKTTLKSAITEACDEFAINNDNNKIDFDKLEITDNIYDKNSNLNIYKRMSNVTLFGFRYINQEYDTLLNNVLVIGSWVGQSPCFYMSKNITNERIWELANHIVNENFFVTLSDRIDNFAPVFKGEKTREFFQLDKDYNYVGMYKKSVEGGMEKSRLAWNLIEEVSDMFIKNTETRNQLASYFLTNTDYCSKIRDFISKSIIKLSENNYDYRSEKMNEILDKDIDEFVKNFEIHYK